MSNEHFDRQYRLRAGVTGAVGFEIGAPSNPHNTALHISFSVEKTDASALNTTKITLWNLNQSELDTLARTNCELTLCAGYGQQLPCLFKGTVTNVVTDLDGSDRMTEIEAIDGFAEIKDTFVCMSYRGKTKAIVVIEAAASKLALPVVYSRSAKQAVSVFEFSCGYYYAGAAKNVLSAACKIAKVSWSIQNGVLHVCKIGETINTTAHILNSDTGLIGVPKKIYNSAVASGEDTGSSLQDSLFGYEVVYLLNGAISVNDLVKLESSVVTGLFRVYKLTIEGDNLEGDWQCTAQLVEVE